MNPSAFNPSISLFSKAKANTPQPGTPSMGTMLGFIQCGTYRKQVEAIRNSSTKEERTELKKALHAVTWAGTFEKRNKQSLKQYSGIICHDIDGLSAEKLESLRSQLKFNPNILAFFVSPSGNGLKILFQLADQDHTQHDQRFEILGNYLNKSYGIEYDPTGRDICRLCFVSYDPELYVNATPAPITEQDLMFWADEQKPAAAQPKAPVVRQPQPAGEINHIQKAHDIVQRTVTAGPGTHNRYAGQFAQQANRYGISEIDCIAELHHYMPAYNQKELVATVKHHYEKDKADYGKYLQNTLFPIATGPTGEGISDYDDSVKFWYVVGKVDKDTGEIVCNATTGEPLGEYRYSYDDAIAFLQNNGFYKYRGENNSYQLIKVDERRKVVDIVIERQVKEYILDYLKSKETAEFKRVREMFRRGSKNYCSTSILEGLDYYNPKLRKDTKDSGYVYFNNCFLEINAEGIKAHNYTEQDNYIWAKQIKPFFYSPEDGESSDFARFLRFAIVGAKRENGQYADKEEALYKAACTSIGYLLHRYKDPTLTKAVITTDKALRHGTENEGRSGKSLFGKALEHMLICTPIDGRNFSFDKDFAFQKVNIDTQLINFNDIKPKFDFTRLFGMITEEFSFEKKGKEMLTIPFEDAPKFYISSNSTLRGEGSSTRARQQILEFSNYFNEQHTPVLEFGKRFFSGWDKDEWSRFFTFMAHCLHLYLKEGMLDFPLENYAINALYETPGAGEELVDYLNETIIEQLKHNKEYDSTKLFEGYKAVTTQKVDWLKKNTFTKWVKQWATIKGLKINAHRPDGRDKRNGVDWMTFTITGDIIAVTEAGAQTEPTTQETPLPF